MFMFYLIGLGLDKEDLSLRAVKILKKCDKVYLDIYTSKLLFKIKEIEKLIGKRIYAASREFVEGFDILENAKEKDVALLVPGDCLSATTHISLILESKKRKIKTEIIHSISIFSAVSETGLQLYKFGKTASMPAWSTRYKPKSFADVIKENMKIKAHTLILLDIGLDVKKALKQLVEACREKKIKLGRIVVCSKLGGPKKKILFRKISELKKEKVKEPACIIIPSELHFLEEEALGELR